mmetsp:Transcript_16244/g.47450  ORF Transcript_16244/g.47450 Transcript_16244/m.47450 type:complete len:388 (-) Transcript_16244:356-1519(-)
MPAGRLPLVEGAAPDSELWRRYRCTGGGHGRRGGSHGRDKESPPVRVVHQSPGDGRGAGQACHDHGAPEEGGGGRGPRTGDGASARNAHGPGGLPPFHPARSSEGLRGGAGRGPGVRGGRRGPARAPLCQAHGPRRHGGRAAQRRPQGTGGVRDPLAAARGGPVAVPSRDGGGPAWWRSRHQGAGCQARRGPAAAAAAGRGAGAAAGCRRRAGRREDHVPAGGVRAQALGGRPELPGSHGPGDVRPPPGRRRAAEAGLPRRHARLRGRGAEAPERHGPAAPRRRQLDPRRRDAALGHPGGPERAAGGRRAHPADDGELCGCRGGGHPHGQALRGAVQGGGPPVARGAAQGRSHEGRAVGAAKATSYGRAAGGGCRGREVRGGPRAGA